MIFPRTIILAALTIGAASLQAQTSQSNSTAAWSDAPRIGQGLAVRGGSAPIERALSTLIPPPYTIRLDESIPRTMQLQWVDSADWMGALRQATRPMGLRILPDWPNNVIVIAAAPTEAAAAPAAPAAANQPVAAVAASRRWEIRLSDQMLSKALIRWSRDAGMPIMWGAPNDLVAVSAVYTGDFYYALESVMRDTLKSAYPLHACAYDNVVRILHTTQSCTN